MNAQIKTKLVKYMILVAYIFNEDLKGTDSLRAHRIIIDLVAEKVICMESQLQPGAMKVQTEPAEFLWQRP